MTEAWPQEAATGGQSTVAEVGHSVLLLVRVCGTTTVCVMDELAVGGESEVAGRTVLLSSAWSVWTQRVLQAGQGRDVGSESQVFSFARTAFARRDAVQLGSGTSWAVGLMGMELRNSEPETEFGCPHTERCSGESDSGCGLLKWTVCPLKT